MTMTSRSALPKLLSLHFVFPIILPTCRWRFSLVSVQRRPSASWSVCVPIVQLLCYLEPFVPLCTTARDSWNSSFWSHRPLAVLPSQVWFEQHFF